MLQQAQNNSISTRQTAKQQLDIELFIDLVRQFPAIWNTRLNGFKDYRMDLKIIKRRLHGKKQSSRGVL